MGYAKPLDAIARHCKGSVKHGVLTPGGIQEVTVIFLGDINRLICHSQLPAAEAFEREVMEVILPAIQQTGTYTVPSDPAVLAAQSNIAAAKQAA